MIFQIRKHWLDFLAIAGLAILGVAIGAYILSQQNLRFPLVQEKPKQVNSAIFTDSLIAVNGSRTPRRCSRVRGRPCAWPAWRSAASPT